MLNNLFTCGGVIVDGLKELTFILDQAIYFLAKVVYNVFYSLANASLLNGNEAIVQKITMRIYVILGILMMFILAWNLLNYIVDPDKINDKKVGATTFIKDVVLALVIISISPILFTKLYSLQNEILTSNVIGNIIFAGGAPVDDSYDPSTDGTLANYYMKKGANGMIADIYVAFLYPTNGFTTLDCDNANSDDEIDYCNAYRSVKKDGDLSAFSDMVTNSDFNFTPLLSTAAGVVLMFFMLSFCINLAKRVGKMAILELIAPIPCTMELLPNKKGTRDNWVKTLIQVYCEVFMFQAIIYLVIFLITLIPGAIKGLFNASGGDPFTMLIATVILIFGLLVFGKEAPKMVFDLLGIKGTGSIKDTIGQTLRLGATGAVGAGLIGSSIGRFSRNFAASNTGGFKGFVKGVGSGIGAMGSGAARTLKGIGNVKNFQDAKALRTNVNRQVTAARINRTNYKAQHGNTTMGAIKGRFSDMKTGLSDATTAYFKGNTFDSYSNSLSNLNKLKGILDSRKKLNDDHNYSIAKATFNDRKTEQFYADQENFLRDYDTLKTRFAGTQYDFDALGISKDENGFMKYITDNNSAGYTSYADKFADIKAAYNDMNTAETAFNDKQVTNDLVAAIKILGTASKNYDVQNLKDRNGNNLVTKLQDIVDVNGQIKTGHTIDDVRSVLKEFSSAEEAKQNEYVLKQAYQDSIKPEKKEKKE